MSYLDLYTKIRTGNMDFHELMVSLNNLYKKADWIAAAKEYIEGIK